MVGNVLVMTISGKECRKNKKRPFTKHESISVTLACVLSSSSTILLFCAAPPPLAPPPSPPPLPVISRLENLTLPKAQRTKGFSSAYESNLFQSYHKVKHKIRSNFIFRILTKYQLQNLDISISTKLDSTKLDSTKFKILTKPCFRISTKIQLHYLYKTSAAKY